MNVGTDAAPDWRLVGEQRSLSYEREREMIDASHKGSDHTKSLYGRQSSTMTLDALYPDPDVGSVATQSILEDAHDNAEEIVVRYRKKNHVLQTTALVGTIGAEFEDNDVSTLSVELTLQGPFQPVPTAPSVAASLNVGAGNAGVRYVADAPGPGGNNIRIAHVAAAAANALTTVAVAPNNLGGSDITVTLGTGATGGTPTATAAQVVAAVNGNAAAAALVTASAIGDGTGIAIVQVLTALSGGA